MDKKKKVELTAQELIERADWLKIVKSVMATKPGRALIWKQMEDGNIFRPCMTGNSNTFYLLGKRDFMIPHYQDIMEACPELWAKAQTENFIKGVTA
jgi:hypothetical protein